MTSLINPTQSYPEKQIALHNGKREYRNKLNKSQIFRLSKSRKGLYIVTYDLSNQLGWRNYRINKVSLGLIDELIPGVGLSNKALYNSLAGF